MAAINICKPFGWQLVRVFAVDKRHPPKNSHVSLAAPNIMTLHQQRANFAAFLPFRNGNRLMPRRCAGMVRASAVHVSAASRPTLVDVPVSNHGARVRHVIYHKRVEDDFDIVSPMAYGGLGSEQYKAINPLNKMPVLLMPDGLVLPESETIVQHILDKWSGSGPSLQAPSANLRAVQHLAARIHDLYITPIQGCMYRKYDAAERARLLEQLDQQIDNLEGICVGPYIAGPDVTTADSALLPTFVFMTYILPKYFGWRDVFSGRPKLAAWWDSILQDPAAQRVFEEVSGALEGWSSKGRWEDLGIVQQLQDHPNFKWAYP